VNVVFHVFSGHKLIEKQVFWFKETKGELLPSFLPLG
jgi:hypothetical protein